MNKLNDFESKPDFPRYVVDPLLRHLTSGRYNLLGPFVTTALWNGSTLSYYILFYYRIFFEYHETDCVVSFSKFLFVGAEKDTTTFLRSLRKTDVDIVSPVLFYLI